MAIVQRRVFYGKVGAADQLVELMKEGDRALQSSGTSLKSRVLTDYMSGRSDRVVVEWEVEDLASIETAMNAAMAGSGGQEFFTEWADRLNQLIHYAEVESWTVR